jgi:hypothetical protein
MGKVHSDDFLSTMGLRRTRTVAADRLRDWPRGRGRRAPILTTIGLPLAYVGFVCLMAGDGFGNLIAQNKATRRLLPPYASYG